MTQTMTDRATTLAGALRGDLFRSGKLPHDETRRTRYGMVANMADADFAPLHEHIAWSVDYWEALHPLSADGENGNSLLNEG